MTDPSSDPKTGAPTSTGGAPATTKPTIKTRLRSLDRSQLIEIIQRMLKSAPDLVDLVFFPVAGEQTSVNADHIRVQVADILLNMGDDWRASTRAEQALWPLVAIGTQYIDRGVLTDARTVFNAIIATMMRSTDSYGRSPASTTTRPSAGTRRSAKGRGL